MLNKFKILTLLSLGLVGVSLLAKPVSLEESEKVAKNWMLMQTGKHFSVQKALTSTSTNTQRDHAQVRIIKLSPEGWVVVSADDVAQPILGYGESPMDLSSQPPGFMDWVLNANQQIEAQIKSGGKLSTSAQSNSTRDKIADSWKMLNVDTQTFTSPKTSSGSLSSSVTPLLWMGGNSEESGINWGQGTGYNAMCPYDSDSQLDSRVPVGCVATAMGQIMKYYSSPTQGAGYHSYTDPNYGVQSADFGSTTYNWSSMPYRLSESSSASEVEAVATISYHAGVSVDMQYTVAGSGAALGHVPNALMTYFDFLYSVVYGRDGSPEEDWNDLLQNELNEGYPILYGGTGEQGGHAFVLDGYDTSGYYHFNWGWDGGANGYFSLDSLTPKESDYTQGQVAVFIIPHFSERKLDIVELYVATFDRASDAVGLDYWADSSLTIEQIAESFFYQPETQKKYPDTLSNSEFVNTIYKNVYNRDADPDGLDYWVNALETETTSRANVIIAIVNGAQGTDATILANKTKVGEYYAYNELDDAELATLVMSNVDETEQSVDDAFEIIDDNAPE